MKRLTLILMTAASAHSAAQWGGELSFCLHSEPKTFNPLLVTEQSADAIRYLTGGRLLRQNRTTLRLEPELAQSWTLSRDGSEIRFEMRAEAKFSDGSPVTAQDAAFTFRTLLDRHCTRRTPKRFARVEDRSPSKPPPSTRFRSASRCRWPASSGCSRRSQLLRRARWKKRANRLRCRWRGRSVSPNTGKAR